MNEYLHSVINGKSILVDNLSLECENGSIEIQMQCVTEEQKSLFIIFENVSKFNLSDISYPFQICGLEIKDFRSHGYQSESRYFINDYEDNRISFYCEKIVISN